MSIPRLARKWHRVGAVVTAVPVLLIVLTGVILHFKKDLAWIQPATRTGTAGAPSITFHQVLEAARSVKEANIESWDDVDRVDVRPEKGMLKVRAINDWELQLDTATGEVLQVAYRRSDLFESLHDGSWWGDPVKLMVFLPSALVLLALWITGIYLWWLPHGVKRRAMRR